jgi:hypothetical protein
MSIITLHGHFLRICNFLLSTQNIIYYSLLQIILFCYFEREIGFTTNNAVEMFPNKFDNMSMVYGVIAQDGYYTKKILILIIMLSIK